MPCYHPLKAFRIGTTAKGKAELMIVPFVTDHLERRSGSWIPVTVPSYSPFSETYSSDWQQIPCGQCLGCRMDYSRQWANRMMLELQSHDEAWFVTLTYNDAQLVRHCESFSCPDPDSGEIYITYSLSKRDVQLFFKRLRKATGQKLRYYLAGEYGDTTFRPHYHAIIYGLHLDDLIVYKRTNQHFTLYNSPLLDRTWSDDYGQIGYVVVAPVTWETCAYTARYVCKKLKGREAEFYQQNGLEPPFSLMSRKPGLAHDWYDAHKGDVADWSDIILPDLKKPRKIKPPRYMRTLLEVDFPEESAILKERLRRIAQDAQDRKLARTDLSYLEYLAVEEASLEARTKALSRGDVS